MFRCLLLNESKIIWLLVHVEVVSNSFLSVTFDVFKNDKKYQHALSFFDKLQITFLISSKPQTD